MQMPLPQLKQVDLLPIAKYYMDQLGVAELLTRYVPNSNGADIEPSQSLEVKWTPKSRQKDP